MSSPPGKPLNILCLDGGGVRGLSSLLILKKLMEELKQTSEWPTDRPNPLPCEVFDLICGTSTGGLTALMLGRLRMSVDQAITSYKTLCEKVFKKKSDQSWFSLWTKPNSPIYEASILADCVKDMVKGRDSHLKDPQDGCCPTFVLAVNEAHVGAPPKCFRSYATRKEHADNCEIWEAARATTAMVPLFAPMKINTSGVNEVFLDGAFSGENNPSRYATDEFFDLYPGHTIGCLLSLGTGVPDAISMKGISKTDEVWHKMVTTCEKAHGDVFKAFLKRPGESYFRFSVDRGFGNIQIDEWNQQDTLTGHTSGYLREPERAATVTNCVKILTAKLEELNIKQKGDVKETLEKSKKGVDAHRPFTRAPPTSQVQQVKRA